MLAAIRGAKTRVFLETFIWKSDETGRRFKEALAEAAERGVEVFVVYDGFANLVVPRSFYRFHPKIHVYRFPVPRYGSYGKPLWASGTPIAPCWKSRTNPHGTGTRISVR